MGRQPGEPVVRALDEIADTRRERRREDAVRQHRHAHVDREHRRELEGRDEGLDVRRQRGRVEQQRQRHADRDEPDLADGVAALEEQVAAEDRGRNATENSYRFPYGPRPTTIPRVTIEAISSEKATSVITRAARESGLGEAASSRGAEDDEACSVTNEPVTPPVAKAGCGTGRTR